MAWDAGHLGKLTRNGAAPDPVMIYSAPTDLSPEIQLDGASPTCDPDSRVIAYWASFVDDQKNAISPGMPPGPFKNTACLTFRCVSRSNLDPMKKVICHDEEKDYPFTRRK